MENKATVCNPRKVKYRGKDWERALSTCISLGWENRTDFMGRLEVLGKMKAKGSDGKGRCG